MENIEKVNDFLNQVQAFYLTTVDGDKPKCRPIAFHMLSNDKIYFGIGSFKDVYKQMQANPYVELCVAVGKEFLRYYGKAVFETDTVIANKALDAMPDMKRIYNEQTGYRLEIFHLEGATAEFRSMMGIQESYSF